MNAVRIPIDEVVQRYEALGELVPVHRLASEHDYRRATDSLDGLLDAGAADPGHPLGDLVHVIGTLIADYEDRHVDTPEVRGADALRFLMEQHALRQSDLPEIGSQGVVSEILAGKRELRVSHIRLLSQRFGVPADVFL